MRVLFFLIQKRRLAQLIIKFCKKKLYHFGIRGLHSIYSNYIFQAIFTKPGNKVSNLSAAKFEVLQGSVLGPILFFCMSIFFQMFLNLR